MNYKIIGAAIALVLLYGFGYDVYLYSDIVNPAIQNVPAVKHFGAFRTDKLRFNFSGNDVYISQNGKQIGSMFNSGSVTVYSLFGRVILTVASN